jgi:hypothetical protein
MHSLPRNLLLIATIAILAVLVMQILAGASLLGPDPTSETIKDPEGSDTSGPPPSISITGLADRVLATPAEGGWLNLRVMDREGHAPVAGSKLLVTHSENRQRSLQGLDIIAVSDEQGQARVAPNVTMESLIASAPGYRPARFALQSDGSGIALVDRAKQLEVHVLAGSEPLQGVTVCATASGGSLRLAQSVSAPCSGNPEAGAAAVVAGVTNARGIVLLDCLVSGEQTVFVGKRGFASTTTPIASAPGGPFVIRLLPIYLAWCEVTGDDVAALYCEPTVPDREGHHDKIHAMAYLQDEIARRNKEKPGSCVRACIQVSSGAIAPYRVAVCGVRTGWTMHSVDLMRADEAKKPQIIDLKNHPTILTPGFLRLRASPKLENLLGDQASQVSVRVRSQVLDTKPPRETFMVHKTIGLGDVVALPGGIYRVDLADTQLALTALPDGAEVVITPNQTSEIVVADPKGVARCRVAVETSVADFDGTGHVNISRGDEVLVHYSRRISGKHQVVWLPLGELEVSVSCHGFSAATHRILVTEEPSSIQEFRISIEPN